MPPGIGYSVPDPRRRTATGLVNTAATQTPLQQRMMGMRPTLPSPTMTPGYAGDKYSGSTGIAPPGGGNAYYTPVSSTPHGAPAAPVAGSWSDLAQRKDQVGMNNYLRETQAQHQQNALLTRGGLPSYGLPPARGGSLAAAGDMLANRPRVEQQGVSSPFAGSPLLGPQANAGMIQTSPGVPPAPGGQPGPIFGPGNPPPAPGAPPAGGDQGGDGLPPGMDPFHWANDPNVSDEERKRREDWLTDNVDEWQNNNPPPDGPQPDPDPDRVNPPQGPGGPGTLPEPPDVITPGGGPQLPGGGPQQPNPGNPTIPPGANPTIPPREITDPPLGPGGAAGNDPPGNVPNAPGMGGAGGAGGSGGGSGQSPFPQPTTGTGPPMSGGAGGGGGLTNPGIIAALLEDFQRANREGKAANETRYNDLINFLNMRYQRGLGNLQGAGDQALEDVDRDYERMAAGADQDLINRGLRNSTVRQSVQRGHQDDRQSNRRRVQEDVRKERAQTDAVLSGDVLSAMERRTDEYPDQNMIAQLTMALGGAGYYPMAGGGGGGGQQPAWIDPTPGQPGGGLVQNPGYTTGFSNPFQLNRWATTAPRYGY
jgi:hypothetical protein